MIETPVKFRRLYRTASIVGRGAKGPLELRRVGLPEGKDLDAVLEVAMQKAGANVAGEDLAGTDTGHEELEAASVLRESEATLPRTPI